MFVYGTLKRGYGNHRLLADSEFLGLGVAPGRLYNFGLPGYKRGTEGTVRGELYRVTDATLARLDTLEGYNKSNPDYSFYNRVVVTVNYFLNVEEDDYVDAYVYEINRDMSEDRLIPEGVW